MEYTDPFALAVPSQARSLGQPPFWTPGQAVTWTYRRFDFDRDHIEVLRPMRVIEDGPDGAALWMPGGTEVTDTRIVGWEGFNAHDVPLDVRFRPPAEAPRRTMVPTRWQGHGVLKLAPPNVPFSVWVLVKPAEAADPSADPVRIEWYINLESTHLRTAEAVFTSDLILDITFPVAEEPPHLPRWPSQCARSRLQGRPRDRRGRAVRLLAARMVGHRPRQRRLVLDRLEDHRWAFDPRWAGVARDLAGFEPGRSRGPERGRSRGSARPPRRTQFLQVSGNIDAYPRVVT
ncbi:DUF402 domain-containing protein [Brevibacterium casei]|nr:DUF402 domain-containing protein [Brevibacterium casei]